VYEREQSGSQNPYFGFGDLYLAGRSEATKEEKKRGYSGSGKGRHLTKEFSAMVNSL
jgi:hypothetical protein